MPSPFPGMDPFLEHPDYFSDFHSTFIGKLREAIQPRLPPNYYASTQTRAWLAIAERQRPIIPDADIRLKRVPQPRRLSSHALFRRVTIKVPEPKRVTVPVDELHEHYVNIYAKKKGGDQLVTSIELLSPSNKTPGDDSRELYLQKQHDLLQADVNLVEIDLLRGGDHTAAVPKDVLIHEAWPFDYHTCVHPTRKLGCFEIYAINLQQPLPSILIPLLAGDSPVATDLQKVHRNTYSTCAFERRVDYRDVLLLTPPLQPEQMAWAVDFAAP